MLKVDKEALERMERRYEGITKSIMNYENADLPPCPHCQSDNTAEVSVGLVGRSMTVAGATTKIKLLPNGPKPGRYYCNNCKNYFGEVEGPSGGFTLRPKDRSFQAFREFVTGVSNAVVPEKNKQELSDAKLLDDWRKFWNLPTDTQPEDVRE